MSIFYIFMLFSSVLASLDSCNHVLNNLLLQYYVGGKEQLISVITPFVQVSGTSPWSYGDYDACLRQGNSYSTVVISSSTFPLPIGFCHSKECTSRDLEEDSIQVKVRNIIKASHILDPYVIINLSQNIDVNKITYQMKEPNSNHDLHPYWTLATIILFITIIIFSIVDPIKNIFFKSEKIYHGINDSIESIQVNEQSSFFEKFSITKNYEETMNLKTINVNLGIFDGFRSVSFFLIIYGHSFSEFAYYVQPYNLIRYLDKWISIIMGDILYAVDIFYWIGGFFIGYILFQNQKVNQLKKYPQGVVLIVVNRILRIWPCYIFAILFHCFIGQKLGGGPRWYMTDIQFQTQKCWQNLLFIDNLFQDDNFCFGWGWYLSSDMQMFLSCLIPLIIYARSQRNGKIAIYMLLIITTAFSIQVSFYYGYTLAGLDFLQKDYFHNYYIKSYCRAPPYYIGLLIGIAYREHKQSEKTIFEILNKWSSNSNKNRYILIFCSYLLGTAIISYLCLGWRGLQQSKDRQHYGPQWFWHLWNGICRPLIVSGLSLLIVPSLLGFHDIFNTTLMNCTIFRFVAKLSFCCYLLHYTVITVIMGSFYETPEYNMKSQFSVFIVSSIITILLAFLLHILVELPFSKLQKQLMDSIMKKKEQNVEKRLV